MALGCMRTLDGPTAAGLKALCSRLLGLHFGHLLLRFNTCSGGLHWLRQYMQSLKQPGKAFDTAVHRFVATS
jgi:hypothetical protein